MVEQPTLVEPNPLRIRRALASAVGMYKYSQTVNGHSRPSRGGEGRDDPPEG